MKFECEFLIGEKLTVETRLEAVSPEAFEDQLRELLNESKKPKRIVYVWRTENGIPRLRGESPIVYIGKAEYGLYTRYIRHVRYEATNYWKRYQHIIRTFGPISIDIYETEKPEMTENTFLFQYQEEFFERPPINMQPYRTSLLTDDQKGRLFQR